MLLVFTHVPAECMLHNCESFSSPAEFKTEDHFKKQRHIYFQLKTSACFVERMLYGTENPRFSISNDSKVLEPGQICDLHVVSKVLTGKHHYETAQRQAVPL